MKIRWLLWKQRFSERLWTALAWHLPHRLVYWAAIRVLTFAKSGKWSNEEAGLTHETALALTRWESRKHPEWK